MKNIFKNPIVQALIFSGAINPLIDEVTSIPKFLLERFKSSFIYQIEVNDGTQFYEVLEDYIAENYGDNLTNFSYVMKTEDISSRYTAAYYVDRTTKDIPEITKAQGYGGFILWNKGKSLFIQKVLREEEKSYASDKYVITCLFSRDPIDEFVVDAVRWADNKIKTSFKAKCYIPDTDSWRKGTVIEKRDFETIFFEQKEEVLKDINRFLERKDWYLERGIPYRRGHLYQGPPGNGKTTFAKGLAYYTKRNIYMLPIDDVISDTSLYTLVSAIPSGSILLIEDIDSFSKAKDRKKVVKTDNNNSRGYVSLSGLLNSLGGIVSKQDVIVIMTTNHPEDLDPALIREGRVDKTFTFDNPTKEAVEEYVKKFTGIEKFSINNLDNSISYAKLQEICLTSVTEEEIKKKINRIEWHL